MLDACDDYGIWYKSTLQMRYFDDTELDCDGNQVEKFHMAFRYPDETSEKMKDGKRYNGWIKDEFDMHLESNAPCFRPFGHYSL